MSYNPALGRWTSADPTGYADGLSVYEYLRSSPISGVDPLGLQTTQPAAPNWNDLKPGDYKGKPDPNGPDAFTGFELTPIYGKAKYDVKPQDCECGKKGFVATASYPDVKVTARFVPEQSYFKGDPTPELLRHEQFHLRLANVGAVRAQNALKSVVGTGVCSPTEAEAKNSALKDLNDKMGTQFDKLFEELKAQEIAYDDATNHGLDDDAQKKWEDSIAGWDKSSGW